MKENETVVCFFWENFLGNEEEGWSKESKNLESNGFSIVSFFLLSSSLQALVPHSPCILVLNSMPSIHANSWKKLQGISFSSLKSLYTHLYLVCPSLFFFLSTFSFSSSFFFYSWLFRILFWGKSLSLILIPPSLFSSFYLFVYVIFLWVFSFKWLVIWTKRRNNFIIFFSSSLKSTGTNFSCNWNKTSFSLVFRFQVN